MGANEPFTVALGHSMGSFVVQCYLLDHSDRLASAAFDEVANILDPSAGIDLSVFTA